MAALVNPNPVLDVNTVRDHLQRKTAESMRSMAGDSAHRIKHYMEDQNLLGRGIFYPQEYCSALKGRQQNKRVDFFLNNGSFFHGYAPKKLFDRERDGNSPSGYAMTLTLKENVLPSEGLQAISGQELSLLGCGDVCQIAQYQAIEDVLGRDKFNYLFASHSKTPLMISGQSPKNPIAKLRNYLLWDCSKKREFKMGDVVHIQSAVSYLDKHLHGEAQAYNAICIDATDENERFAALGTDENGLTREGFSEQLLQSYNGQPVPLDFLSPAIQKSHYALPSYAQRFKNAPRYKNVQLSMQQFQQQNGGRTQIVCELDPERVTLLAL